MPKINGASPPGFMAVLGDVLGRLPITTKGIAIRLSVDEAVVQAVVERTGYLPPARVVWQMVEFVSQEGSAAHWSQLEVALNRPGTGVFHPTAAAYVLSARCLRLAKAIGRLPFAEQVALLTEFESKLSP